MNLTKEESDYLINCISWLEKYGCTPDTTYSKTKDKVALNKPINIYDLTIITDSLLFTEEDSSVSAIPDPDNGLLKMILFKVIERCLPRCRRKVKIITTRK